MSLSCSMAHLHYFVLFVCFFSFRQPALTGFDLDTAILSLLVCTGEWGSFVQHGTLQRVYVRHLIQKQNTMTDIRACGHVQGAGSLVVLEAWPWPRESSRTPHEGLGLSLGWQGLGFGTSGLGLGLGLERKVLVLSRPRLFPAGHGRPVGHILPRVAVRVYMLCSHSRCHTTVCPFLNEWMNEWMNEYDLSDAVTETVAGALHRN